MFSCPLQPLIFFTYQPWDNLPPLSSLQVDSDLGSKTIQNGISNLHTRILRRVRSPKLRVAINMDLDTENGCYHCITMPKNDLRLPRRKKSKHDLAVLCSLAVSWFKMETVIAFQKNHVSNFGHKLRRCMCNVHLACEDTAFQALLVNLYFLL